MWHASGMGGDPKRSRTLARMALGKVGDRQLGEWVEQGSRGIVHIRRRLSVAEQQAFDLMEVRDVRGTSEERDRLMTLLTEAPHLAHIVRAMRQ